MGLSGTRVLPSSTARCSAGTTLPRTVLCVAEYSPHTRHVTNSRTNLTRDLTGTGPVLEVGVASLHSEY
eukprot:2028888-Rhodomonas_salina.4